MFGTDAGPVVKIEPEQVKPFEEVAAEIKQTIAADRARSEMPRATTRSRTSAAPACGSPRSRQKLGLTARTIEAVDRRGAIPTASRSPACRAASMLIGTRVHVRHRRRQRAAADPRRRLCLVRGAGIKPARERTLDEVTRRRSRSAGATTRSSERLQGQGDRDGRKLKAGTPFADVAAAEGLSVQTTFGLKRGGNRQHAISPRVIEAVFRTAEGRGRQRRGQRPGRMGRVPA